ncbi:hypothetical protein ACQQ2N_13320 [Dokdonella sp. MW10]|uniref:hypothetical protein n=1 Tax=Dokdonella sp. MW10 TaxID=2992926 RepID=UPI003F7D075A
MVIHTATTKFPHWNYFIALEEDLERASRYVELVEDNEKTYSLEFVHLLFAAAAEVETVMVLLCHLFDPKSEASKFSHCVKPLREAFPEMWREKVVVPRFGLTLQPWDEWRKKNKTPFWWQSYNHVKHARHKSFAEATMKNAVNAMAALYLVTLELSCRERTHDGLHILATKDVMTSMIVPRARLFEVGGRR